MPSRLVRLVRRFTDPIAPLSFNRQGFALHRRGFDDDLPENLDGRVVLVTGANSGIGLATTRALARRGAEVWMLCRDRARGEAARAAVASEHRMAKVHLAVIDVSNLASIEQVANDLPLDRVDVLVHNAGMLADTREPSADGVELTFATHVLGPFALTQRLLGRLTSSEDPRLVFVASAGLYGQRLDLGLVNDGERPFDGVRAYANAKRAQVILGHVLAERIARLTVASMHPGWVETPALRASLPRFHALMEPLLRTPEQGADTVVWLAARPRVSEGSGDFWFDRQVVPEYPVPFPRETPADRAALVALCERLSGLRFPETT